MISTDQYIYILNKFLYSRFWPQKRGKTRSREVGLLVRSCLPGDGTPSAMNAGSPWYQDLTRLTPFVPVSNSNIKKLFILH